MPVQSHTDAILYTITEEHTISLDEKFEIQEAECVIHNIKFIFSTVIKQCK